VTIFLVLLGNQLVPYPMEGLFGGLLYGVVKDIRKGGDNGKAGQSRTPGLDADTGASPFESFLGLLDGRMDCECRQGPVNA
jgi:hypothetical protein